MHPIVSFSRGKDGVQHEDGGATVYGRESGLLAVDEWIPDSYELGDTFRRTDNSFDRTMDTAAHQKRI